MKHAIIIFCLAAMTFVAHAQPCDLKIHFETVFTIYQEELDPYLTKFSQNQYRSSGQIEAYKLLVQTRISIYNMKVASLKTKCLDGLSKENCKESEAQNFAFISGFLDLIFRYEFPGLDSTFYDNVNERVVKLSTKK